MKEEEDFIAHIGRMLVRYHLNTYTLATADTSDYELI